MCWSERLHINFCRAPGAKHAMQRSQQKMTMRQRCKSGSINFSCWWSSTRPSSPTNALAVLRSCSHDTWDRIMPLANHALMSFRNTHHTWNGIPLSSSNVVKSLWTNFVCGAQVLLWGARRERRRSSEVVAIKGGRLCSEYLVHAATYRYPTAYF